MDISDSQRIADDLSPATLSSNGSILCSKNLEKSTSAVEPSFPEEVETSSDEDSLVMANNATKSKVKGTVRSRVVPRSHSAIYLGPVIESGKGILENSSPQRQSYSNSEEAEGLTPPKRSIVVS